MDKELRSKIFRDAINIPWCQRSLYKNKEGKPTQLRKNVVAACLLGKLYISLNKNGLTEYGEEVFDFLKPMAAELGISYDNLALWNDDPKRTESEVNNLLKTLSEKND